jgi:hypothetical protein
MARRREREYGEGSLVLRGGRWHITYSHRGRLYRESSKSTDRKVALRLLKRRLAEIHSGRHAPAAEKVTLGDLRRLVETEYERNGRKGLPRIRLAFDHIDDYFGPETRALDITPDRLSDYHRARVTAGAAPATVSLEFSALKRGFSLAIRAERLQGKPVFPVVRVSNARQGWPTANDLARLLPELTPHVRPVIRFAAITGWRIRSEILRCAGRKSRKTRSALRWAQPRVERGGPGRCRRTRRWRLSSPSSGRTLMSSSGVWAR